MKETIPIIYYIYYYKNTAQRVLLEFYCMYFMIIMIHSFIFISLISFSKRFIILLLCFSMFYMFEWMIKWLTILFNLGKDLSGMKNEIENN